MSTRRKLSYHIQRFSFDFSNEPPYAHAQRFREFHQFNISDLANPHFNFGDHDAIRVPALQLKFLCQLPLSQSRFVFPPRQLDTPADNVVPHREHMIEGLRRDFVPLAEHGKIRRGFPARGLALDTNTMLLPTNDLLAV